MVKRESRLVCFTHLFQVRLITAFISHKLIRGVGPESTGLAPQSAVDWVVPLSDMSFSSSGNEIIPGRSAKPSKRFFRETAATENVLRAAREFVRAKSNNRGRIRP